MNFRKLEHKTYLTFTFFVVIVSFLTINRGW